MQALYERSRSLLLALTCVFITSVLSAEEGTFPTPIEFVPYAVEFRFDLPPEEQRGGMDVEGFLREFRAEVKRSAGERWSVTHQAESHSPWARSSTWDTLEPSVLHQPEETSTAEFVYLVRVRRQPGALVAELRVWEPLLGTLSPVRTIATHDERTVPERAARAAWELFRPRGHWEKIDDGRVRLQLQAAGLGDDTGLPPLVEPGEVFAPWIVIRKRDHSVERTVPQAWTYLVAQELNDGRGEARIVSGIRNPLGLKPRGRVEFLAVAARAQWPESRFTFRRQSSPPQVLAAHEVQWHRDQFPLDEEHPPELHRQLTDRFGRVTLRRAPESRLVWLSITSGSQLLARLPIVPGEEPVRDVMLPNDSLRLQVEGQLQLVQSDLISFVATRTALIAIVRAAAKKSDWTTVDAQLKKLDTLPTPQSFLDRVTAIRVTAVAKARSLKDRTSEQRILRIADDTAELVKRYLNDDKLTVLKEEVAELRKAESDVPDPKAPPS